MFAHLQSIYFYLIDYCRVFHLNWSFHARPLLKTQALQPWTFTEIVLLSVKTRMKIMSLLHQLRAEEGRKRVLKGTRKD